MLGSPVDCSWIKVTGALSRKPDWDCHQHCVHLSRLSKMREPHLVVEDDLEAVRVGADGLPSDSLGPAGVPLGVLAGAGHSDGVGDGQKGDSGDDDFGEHGSGGESAVVNSIPSARTRHSRVDGRDDRKQEEETSVGVLSGLSRQSE